MDREWAAVVDWWLDSQLLVAPVGQTPSVCDVRQSEELRFRVSRRGPRPVRVSGEERGDTAGWKEGAEDGDLQRHRGRQS